MNERTRKLNASQEIPISHEGRCSFVICWILNIAQQKVTCRSMDAIQVFRSTSCICFPNFVLNCTHNTKQAICSCVIKSLLKNAPIHPNISVLKEIFHCKTFSSICSASVSSLLSNFWKFNFAFCILFCSSPFTIHKSMHGQKTRSYLLSRK